LQCVKEALCGYNVAILFYREEKIMTDCIVRSRIDSHIKTKAEMIFEHMGLTLSEAIRHEENLGKTSLEQLKKDWNSVCKK
jgi:hypothetical protein